MAKFGEPSHHQHMQAGIKAAFASAKTPAHLKPHLEARMKQHLEPDADEMGGRSDMDRDNMMPRKPMMPMTTRMKRTAAKLSPKRKAAKLVKKPNAFFGE